MIGHLWGAKPRNGRLPISLVAIALALAIAGSAGLVGLATDLLSSGALRDQAQVAPAPAAAPLDGADRAGG